MQTHAPATLKRARALRKNMSLPEVLLWNVLKGKPNGLKFRRQHPYGRFVADFYCYQAKLIVEVDGASHDMGDRPAVDATRDSWFRGQGLNVLRIPATMVLQNVNDAVETIVATVAGFPLHRPTDGSPPPKGEEF